MIALIVALYALVTTVRGDTFFGISLRSGSLSDGLIAHWTFDGKYMTPNVRDAAGSYHGVLTNQTATTTRIGRIGQALEFDGDNDYVNLGTIPLSDPLQLSDDVLTISAWFYQKSGGDSFQRIIDKSSNTGATNGWAFFADPSDPNSIWFQSAGSELRSADNVYNQNEWTHAAVVFRANDVKKIYVNGQEVSLQTSNNLNIPNSAVGARIGTWYNATTREWNGYLDDIRVYNRLLSANEIKRLYGLGNTTRISKTISVGSIGATADSGLVGHWTFDGKHMTPNVRDTSGQANHGALANFSATTTAIGRIGQALEFDGLDDVVAITHNSVLNPSGSYTVAAWVYPQTLPTVSNGQWIGIVAKGNTGETSASNHPYVIAYHPVGGGSPVGFGVGLENSSGSNCNAFSSDAEPAGAWYHVVSRFNDSSNVLEVFVNGVSQGSDACSLSPNTGNSRPVWIGDDEHTSGLRFDGVIDDVRIYNRALVDDEIQRLYDQGSGTRITYTPPAEENTAPTVSDSGRSPFHGADLGGSSSIKLFMNTWTDPEGDSIEYYFEFFQNAAFCSGGTGILNSGWISDPTATGGFTVALSAGSTYSWHVKARDEHGLESDYNACYVFTNSIGGSCPYVFGWDGEQYQFEADIYGSGGLGYKKWGASDFVQPSPNRTYVLKYVEPRNGAFEWRIVGDLSEINYFDLFRMYSYFVPEDRDIIVESPTLGSGMSATSTLHTISTAPLSALSATRLDTNEDVTSALSARDEDKVIVNKNKKETYEPVQIEVDFGDISRYSTKKLVVGGSTTYPTTEEGIARKQLYGREWGLYVQDAAGQWQKVPYEKYSPTKPLSFESVLAVDISDIFISENTKLRLEYLYKVYVDYVALDVTEDLPLAVAEEHPITYADLHDFGGWHDFDKDGNVPDYYNVSPLEEDYEDFPGYYTRFGDVTPLLEKRDDKFVILAKRDEITVKNALPKIEPPTGYKRVYMLDVTGYYKALTKTMTPMTVEPMPFSGMSAFPYPDTEHYPDTPEYQEYRAKYNTRYLSPDTPRSGSSITDAAKRLLDGVLGGE
ncbi:MAG: hypothetical protein AMXMBFR44_0800 [Candidatus Campbellbacteria bacterium]